MAARNRPSKEEVDALEAEVKKIESEFEVHTSTLQKIADTLASELGKGLTKTAGSIPLYPTWVLDSPNGREKGHYIGIDLGRTIKGTNLRICEIQFLDGKGEFDITQSSYKVPREVRTGTSAALSDFVASCLKSFREQVDNTVASHIALTFSFPVEQEAIDDARLIKWLRGFDVKDAIGNEVVSLMQKGLDATEVPMKFVGVLNDSVGTLMASAYADPGVRTGAILGTGSSVAYFEECGKIEKLSDKGLDPKKMMAINCQWGEFQSDDLPLTRFDKQVDKGSEPGEHVFEKLFAGLYLPEILRLIIIELKAKSLIFRNSDCKKIQDSYTLDIALMRIIESDPFDNMFGTGEQFQDKLGINADVSELKALRRIAKAISTRAARMVASGLVGLYKHQGNPSPCIVGTDGSMFLLYPTFRKRILESLAAIQGSPADQIQLTFAQDGNGVGAALVAAMTTTRARNGDTAGIKNAEALK